MSLTVVLPANPPAHVRRLMDTLGFAIIEEPMLPRPRWWVWDDDGRDGLSPLREHRERYERSRVSAAERTAHMPYRKENA